jgi:Holliday junction resolvase
MGRRAARVDANQNEIVTMLRKMGYSVAISSDCGKGFPDIVVGRSGKNYLFEIKDGNKPPSAQKLTDAEQQFADAWKGQYNVITCLDDAIKILRLSD